MISPMPEESATIEVELDDLRALVERRAVLLVDASTQGAFDLEHLPRARSVPLEDLEARARAAIPGLDADFVVYCGSPD